MGKVKTFEEFMGEKSIKEASIHNVGEISRVLSPQLQEKLNRAFADIIEECIDYNNDSNEEHTAKEYLNETVLAFSKGLTDAMNSNGFFDLLHTMTYESSEAKDFNEGKEDLTKSKETIRLYLDECHDAMIQLYTNKIIEAKKGNSTTAGLILNKYKNTRL